ncbi:MFS general substrate transporter [Rhizophagus irregularis]|uniref:MFS general substrate transporter n=1 Tax=Rhizophagus irregularis TaxID=588596 RepID=A0A2I1GDQ5_9GLOM|nr:MFS general substrate transporter [Rhizophagus irregularis]PKY44763.1 MFS general substrate transporter [Rhizophagus irregularis]
MSTKNSNDIDEERTMFIKLPSSGTDAAEIVVEDDNSSDDSILLQDDIAKKQTALDSVITKIGMGKFQKQLLVLCGLGWLADNMWLQCIAVILPRVQKHFGLPNSLIGALSSSLFTGMMFGALFWGVLSDTHGRKQAFNWTLAVTTFFGIIASFAQSFFQLCFMLFLLGFGVGGNMPVDGALFLEFIPKEHQYLLTFMSVFFSFGAVLSSVLAYFILPPNSCTEDDCNVFEENNGWRYMLAILGSLTFLMLMCRIFFFQLQESPKYLISRNRKHDAVLVLRKIAKINGNNMQIQASDFPTPANTTNPRNRSFSSFPFPNETQHAKVEFISDPISYIKYKTSSNIEVVMSLFTRKWFMTTILVWCIWTLVSFAYTMFNVFLPKYLESLGLDNGESDSLMQDVLKDYVVYSLCGVPGSLAAAWLIETVLGRIGTMSIATFGTALSVFLFSVVKSHSSEIISSAMVSFLATLNYAVIYGYTPEVFESKVRGTACGIASAFGRVAGIIAPMVTGLLLSISVSVPLYVSALLFTISGICMVLLPIETKGRQA